MINQIPLALIYSRLIIGVAILVLSIQRIDHYELVAIILLSIGLLTDIFDGIIARRLNISTQKLRRLDSTIDQLFFIGFTVAAYIQCSDFFKTHFIKVSILLAFEGLIYFVSFLKFKKEVATHSLGAKAWSILLFATLIEIIAHCQSDVLFEICFWVGIISRIEIALIILTLKRWTNDVPTLYHSLKLRQGKEIKRHKLFNG